MNHQNSFIKQLKTASLMIRFPL